MFQSVIFWKAKKKQEWKHRFCNSILGNTLCVHELKVIWQEELKIFDNKNNKNWNSMEQKLKLAKLHSKMQFYNLLSPYLDSEH